MRTRLTSKPLAYGLFVVAAVFGGIAARRPELVVLGVPFALGLAVALTSSSRPSISASASSAPARVIEGDEVGVEVVLDSAGYAGHVEVALQLPEGIELAGAPLGAVVATAGEHLAAITLRAARWGAWRMGPVVWRSRDPGGFVTFEEVVPVDLAVRVHPRPEELRRLLRPAATRALTGSHTARLAAQGTEFAEVRPYSASDSPRDVNWRVSSRRGDIWVNRRHPERNSDVVVLVDAFSETTLVPAVSAAANVVAAYVGQRDRVGVVSFGGVVQWVEPSVGTRHLYRLLDSLLSTGAMPSFAWKDLHVLPPRTLPPNALVIAVSGLDDPRMLEAIGDLAARGVDMAVVEIPVHELCPPGPRPSDALAHRLWTLRRVQRREQLRRRGVPVAVWSEDVPLAGLLDELSVFRRHVGRGRG